MSLMLDAAEAQERARRLRGIGLMLLATLCFAALDATAKTLVVSYAALQVVFVRFFVHLVLTVSVGAPSGLGTLWRTRRPGLLLLRASFLIGSTTFNFLALRHLQLAETMSIYFSTPLLVAVLAGPLLGEWIGARRWTAVLLGFAGVLIITRPGLGGIHWAAAYSVAAAVCYAFYAITTRVLAASDGNAAQQFYAALLGTLVFLPFMPAVWVWPQDLSSLALMLALGTFGMVGHGFLITAHRYAPAPVLSPFIYVQIVWAVSLGYIVFADVPGIWTVIGGSVVVGSGLYLLFRERQVRARARP